MIKIFEEHGEIIMFGRLNSYIALFKSRFLEAFSYTWLTIVGAMIISHGSPKIAQTLLAATSVFSLVLCVYIYNDYTDKEMDALNPSKSRRPLPSEKATKIEARNFIYMTGFIGLALSLLVNIETSLLCLFWMGLFLAYSKPEIRLKKRMILKESTPAIGYFLATLIGAKANGPITMTVFFSGIVSGVFIFFSLPAFRDTTDIKEDTLHGVKSLASILTWKQRLEMVIIIVLAIMTLTPLTYVNFGFNVIFPIVTVAMGFLLLRFLFPLLKGLEEKKYRTALKIGTSYFFLMQISMILGALPIIT
ncbi:MAG: UbiA family prenyltransferase [Candidatus Bathyarchaeia archaeon]